MEVIVHASKRTQRNIVLTYTMIRLTLEKLNIDRSALGARSSCDTIITVYILLNFIL